MKNKLFSFFVIISLAMLTTFGILLSWIWFSNEKISKCPDIDYGYYNIDTSFKNCYGLISIDSWNKSIVNTKYNLRDYRHGYYIAGIHNLEQYKVIGDKLYVVDSSSGESKVKFGNQPWVYEEEFFINGEIKKIYYDSIEDIPLYRVIDTQTGNVTLYHTYEEMPEEDKAIFQELENKITP